jgi:hypothetical protein
MKSFSLSTAYFSAGLGFGIANATYTILVLSLFLQTFTIQALFWFWTLSGIIGFVGWRLYANTQIKTSYARLSTYVILFSIGLLFFWAFGFDCCIQSPILKEQKIFFAASFIWLLNFL